MNNIDVACPCCHQFFYGPESALIKCECGTKFVAIRIVRLTDNHHLQHPCLAREGKLLATNKGHALYALSPPKVSYDGSCAMTSCQWGAPFLLANDAEELLYFSKSTSRTNIYPVIESPGGMQHATTWRSLVSILQYGLLPNDDPRMRGYSSSGHIHTKAEGWLRYTGQRKAAEFHFRSDGQGLILPIRYDQLVLQSCMGLEPSSLMRLFDFIPHEIGCIRMDEDGDSYVFRREVYLPIDFVRMPLFFAKWLGWVMNEFSPKWIKRIFLEN